MIWAVVILAAGIVLAVLSVLLRKKLGRGWMASLLAAGILLTACGGWLTHGQLDQRQQTRENVYLGRTTLSPPRPAICWSWCGGTSSMPG